jgi:hypothetical protein
LTLAIQKHSAIIRDQKKHSVCDPESTHTDASNTVTRQNSKLQPYIDAHRKFWTS